MNDNHISARAYRTRELRNISVPRGVLEPSPLIGAYVDAGSTIFMLIEQFAEKSSFTGDPIEHFSKELGIPAAHLYSVFSGERPLSVKEIGRLDALCKDVLSPLDYFKLFRAYVPDANNLNFWCDDQGKFWTTETARKKDNTYIQKLKEIDDEDSRRKLLGEVQEYIRTEARLKLEIDWKSKPAGAQSFPVLQAHIERTGMSHDQFINKFHKAYGREKNRSINKHTLLKYLKGTCHVSPLTAPYIAEVLGMKHDETREFEEAVQADEAFHRSRHQKKNHKPKDLGQNGSSSRGR